MGMLCRYRREPVMTMSNDTDSDDRKDPWKGDRRIRKAKKRTEVGREEITFWDENTEAVRRQYPVSDERGVEVLPPGPDYWWRYVGGDV